MKSGNGKVRKKHKLLIELLKKEASDFCKHMSKVRHDEIVGITDGKAVGTLIEHKFREIIRGKYKTEIGNSANGIDFPGPDINTDVKTTSITQPQSSCPFKSAAQKIYGLGYNVMVFVYEKDDKKTFNLNFLHCVFVDKERTGDYQTTSRLRELLENKANADDVKAFLIERNLPIDEIGLEKLAKKILNKKPEQGYLTISNALQWRLQYSRVIGLTEYVAGVHKLYAPK